MEYKVRFCDQCGAKLEDGAKFCTNCGSKITAADPTPASVPQAEPETVSQLEYAPQPAPETVVMPEEDVEYIEPIPEFKHVDVEPVESEPIVETSEPVTAQAAEPEQPAPETEPEEASDYDGEETVCLSNASDESAEQRFARMATPANLHKCRSGEYVNVDKPEFILGKNPLRTDFAVRDNNTVSRVHAVIKWTEDGYSIADLGSMNGTFVNGVPVSEEGHMLYDGDVITLSDEEFKFSLIEI